MTTNQDYNIPEQGSVNWHIPLNENFEKIDTGVEVRDTESNRSEYTPKEGCKYLAVDTGDRYVGDGETWIEAPSHPRLSSVIPARETDPENPDVGAIWYKKDTDEIKANLGSVVTVASPEESSDVSPFKVFEFDDPAPEAEVGTRYESNRGTRDIGKLESELSDRGWDSYNYHVPNNLFYNDQNTVQGSHSMEFCYPGDERMGFDLKASLDREECWAQYYVKFEEGFEPFDEDFGKDWATGGKLPGWGWRTGSIGCAGGGDWYDGCEGWSARCQFEDTQEWYSDRTRDSGEICVNHYVYHQGLDDGGGPYGTTVPFDLNGRDGHTVDVGSWNEITLHCRMNDPGQSNGVLEAWIDNLDDNGPTKGLESSDWEFRDTSDVNIGSWWHVSYFGGGWYSPKDQSLYTDNLRFYDQNPL